MCESNVVQLFEIHKIRQRIITVANLLPTYNCSTFYENNVILIFEYTLLIISDNYCNIMIILCDPSGFSKLIEGYII